MAADFSAPKIRINFNVYSFQCLCLRNVTVLSVGGRSLCSLRWLHNICLCSLLCGQGCSDSAVYKILWQRDKTTSEPLECINVGRNANVLSFSSVVIYRYPRLFASCVLACVGLSVWAGQCVGWPLKVLKEVFAVHQLMSISCSMLAG